MFILVLLSSPETVHFIGASVGADRQGRGHAATDPQAQRKGGSTLSAPGRHADGGGLYLSISKDGASIRRRWVFLYRRHGRLKKMGLGGATTVTLAQARELANRWRTELGAGRDPITFRDIERRTQAGMRTFGEFAQTFWEAKSQEWRNEKVRTQWLTPLRTYADICYRCLSTRSPLRTCSPFSNQFGRRSQRQPRESEVAQRPFWTPRELAGSFRPMKPTPPAGVVLPIFTNGSAFGEGER